jgi:hypothetical protein
MSYVEQRLLVVLKEAIEEENEQQKKYAQRAQEAKESAVKLLFASRTPALSRLATGI